MKISEPTAEEYARTAQSQRKHARQIADLLERGDPLESLGDPLAGKFAAAILRAWANNLPNYAKRKRGHAPQFPSGEAALMVECRVAGGSSRRAAIEGVATLYGVSAEAIKKALRKDGAEARALLGLKT